MDNASNHPAVPIPLTEQLRQLAAADPGLLDTLAKAASPEVALQHMAEASTRTGLPIDLDAARAAMMQALGSAEPLSDEALAEVAGGARMGAAVYWSIASLGFFCAVISVAAVGYKQNCGEALSRLPPP